MFENSSATPRETLPVSTTSSTTTGDSPSIRRSATRVRSRAKLVDTARSLRPRASAVDLAGELLALIDQRLEDPMVSDDERGRLERLRGTVGDVGKGIVTGLLTALIKAHTGA